MYSRFGHLLQVVNTNINTNTNRGENSLTYEMGYTSKEFKKTLTGLFISQTPYSCKESTEHSWQITVEGETITVDIEIEERSPRIIALLTLPVLKVSFEFQKSNKNQQQTFMQTFFKYFHKGGG